MRASARGLNPPASRVFAFPSDISFLDLHLLLQAIAGWGSRNSHCFRVGDKKIGPEAFGVLEEADVQVGDYEGSRIAYEYGPFVIDLMFLKGKTQDVEKPVILEAKGYFPPEECKSLDEYAEVLALREDESDPSHLNVVSWLQEVEDGQDTEALNREMADTWERIGKIEGRIPFNVGATIGALLITGSEGYFYDREKKRITEESDGSERFIPIDPFREEFVLTLAGIYSDMVGVKSDNLLETLLEDEYRQGWEEYAENFLDEVTDRWADRYGFIIEAYADSDLSRMMESFDSSEEQ
jgi:hypothetical protein